MAPHVSYATPTPVHIGAVVLYSVLLRQIAGVEHGDGSSSHMTLDEHLKQGYSIARCAQLRQRHHSDMLAVTHRKEAPH
jgi:hypothetical protein